MGIFPVYISRRTFIMAKKKELSYKNDVVFKYIFGSDHEESLFLRRFIISQLVDGQFFDYSIKNPDILRISQTDKQIIQDIIMTDNNRKIGMEMQDSLWTTYQKLRFQYYMFRHIVIQLMSGEKNYGKLKEFHLILFIDDYHFDHQLKENLDITYEEGKKFKECLVHLHIIFLKEIDRHIKNKDTINEFESMIYLMRHGYIYQGKREKEKEIVEIMEKRMIEMKKNEKLVDYALTEIEKRNLIKLKEELDKEDGFKDGFKDGEESGIRLSLIETLTEQIEIKYSITPTWLNECSIGQLKILRRLILSNITYQDLLRSVK